MADIMELTDGEPEIDVPDGEHVLRAGERSGSLYVLVSGTLRVERDGRPVAELTDPGAIVGELGLLLDTTASADVVAVGPTVVRRLDDAERCFVDYPDFGRHLATVLATRLAHVSSYLADLERQYADRADTLGVVPDVLAELLGGHDTLGVVPDVLAELLGGHGEQLDPGSDREPDSPY